MKITVEIPDQALGPAIEYHLTNLGLVSVQSYFVAALHFFNKLRLEEIDGKALILSRYASANSETVSPKAFLQHYDQRP